MAPSSQPVPTLSPSHPLIAELTSLRQQLAQYQKSGHQSAIQLQGAKLELNLAKEETAVLRETNETLRSEINVLRTHPLPPTQPPTSTTLAELTLAHRRLSTKLDLTEQALQSCQLELASCKQEIGRLNKEREGDRATINELRRGEEEREEEIAWERGERRKAEALKRLCDLALDDYKDLVQSLDPRAVHPSSPSEKIIDPPTELSSKPETDLITTADSTGPSTSEAVASSESIPSAQPASTSTHLAAPTLTTATTPSPSEAISNLLVGQRGVNRLFEDFTSTLSTRDKEIHRLKDRLEEIEHTLSTVTEQLDSETSLRIEAESQRDKIMRDDASAAKVVERYMTFTQKTHATVHLHLDNLRARSVATQQSLRKELNHTQTRLSAETERAERLRLALDEASENLSREVGGRRREVGLRLKMISNEERRERKIEIWLDKVRRQREGVEGAVLEADILESLLDEGIDAYTIDRPGRNGNAGNNNAGPSTQLATKDKQRSWRGMISRKRGNSTATDISDNGEASSIARVLLAEELVDTLVKDLQVETERRMALEQQRVEWLAQEAVEGREVGEGEGEREGDRVMFDLDQHVDEEVNGDVQKNEAATKEDSKTLDDINDPEPITLTIPLETPPPLEPTPSINILSSIFLPLREIHQPLQSSLHSLTHSLADLRASLPPTSSNPLKRRNPLSDPTLLSILENLHESLEDARVDVEIAIADEDRVYRGFEALLGVGEGGGVVQSKDVLGDAREYVIFKKDETGGWVKLNGKVQDLEMDLMSIKSKIHELEGMEISFDVDADVDVGREDEEIGNLPSPSLSSPLSPMISKSSPTLRPRNVSIWSTLPLRTITTTPTPTTPVEEGGGGGGRRRLGLGGGMFGGVSNVGRSLSASVISAPRKVGGFAGGLYKPRTKVSAGEGEKEGLINENQSDRKDGDGDVE